MPPASIHVVITELRAVGARAYTASVSAATGSLNRMSVAYGRLSAAQAASNKNSFLHNQMLFSARRYAFYGTLAVTGLVAAVGKLGFSYLNTFNTVQTAIGPFLRGTDESIQHVTSQLFKLAAFTPFTFQQVARAFQMMFVGMKGLGISAAQTQKILEATIDLLAAGGTLTELNLRRVSNALQDLAYQGELTGRMVSRLAQIGIPIRDILRKQFHLTGEEIANIKDQGIDALDVLEAITKFRNQEPGFRGAAFRLSQRTLSGAFTTLSDLVSQASGGASKGIYETLRKNLVGINTELAKFYDTDKPVTLTALAEAMDKQLSPKTHILLRLFISLEYFVKTITVEFYLLIKAIQFILTPFDKLADVFDRNKTATKLFGIYLGTLLVLWTIGKTKVILFHAALDLAKISMWGYTAAVTAADIAMTIFEGLVFGARTALWALQAIILRTTIAMWQLDAAMFANPIGLVIIGVLALTAGLVVLYFKWKAFHDFVDRTFHLIQRFPYLAFLVPIYGQVIFAIVIIQKLYNIIKKLYDLLHKPMSSGWIGKIGRVAAHINPITAPFAYAQDIRDIGRATHILPSAHTDRTMSAAPPTQPTMDRLPGGLQVIPAGAGGALGDLNMKVILRVDGKDLADTVAKHRLDRQARR